MRHFKVAKVLILLFCLGFPFNALGQHYSSDSIQALLEQSKESLDTFEERFVLLKDVWLILHHFY